MYDISRTRDYVGHIVEQRSERHSNIRLHVVNNAYASRRREEQLLWLEDHSLVGILYTQTTLEDMSVMVTMGGRYEYYLG